MNYSSQFESIKHILELKLNFPSVRLMGESELGNQIYKCFLPPKLVETEFSLDYGIRGKHEWRIYNNHLEHAFIYEYWYALINIYPNQFYKISPNKNTKLQECDFDCKDYI